MSDLRAAQSRFDNWNAPDSSFTVEYRHGLMQELRAAVAYGQQAFTRGGMEVGGVLLGTRSPGGISIRTWRPISCEHASGPALVLSERDRGELKKFLAEAATLPDLAGVEPVGWFLSHTRSDISLRESDLNLYQEFFPAATDVALVLRPGRHGAARAGFFLRGHDGIIQNDHSLLEFNIEGDGGRTSPPPHAAPNNHTPANTASPWLKPHPEEDPDLYPEADLAGEPPAIEMEPALTGKSSWRWIALPVAAMLAIGWLYMARNRTAEPSVVPIEMTVTDRAGQLLVEWDHSRPELRQVRAGEISVTDAGNPVNVALTAAEAQAGSFTWARKSGDVQVSLRLEGAGKPLGAFARFLGEPPSHSKTDRAAAPDTTELDTLRKENADLRGEVERAKAQASQAETVIRILHERVDAAESKK